MYADYIISFKHDIGGISVSVTWIYRGNIEQKFGKEI